MLKIKYLLIMIFIPFMVNASELDPEYKFSGTIDMSYSQDKKELVNQPVHEISYTQLEVNLNNDVYFDNSKLVFSPGYLNVSEKTYNNVIRKDIPEVSMLFINELYYAHNLTNELSVSAGQYTFRKGTFYEHNYNGNRVGNGLFSNMDIMLQGGIVSYKTENNVLNIGNLRFDRWGKSYYDFVDADTHRKYEDYQNSGGTIVMDKFTYGKWFFEVDYYDLEQFASDKKMMDTKLYGLGISYDDYLETGRTYYSIVTYNESVGDNTYLSPLINPFTKQPMAFDKYGAYFGKFKSTGHSILTGVKQELDNVAFNKDIVVSGEVIYKSPGYHSLLAGMPFSPYAYTDIGYTYNISLGLRINKDLMLKTRYSKYDPDGEATKLGLSTDVTDVNNVNGSIKSSSTLSVQLYYEF